MSRTRRPFPRAIKVITINKFHSNSPNKSRERTVEWLQYDLGYWWMWYCFWRWWCWCGGPSRKSIIEEGICDAHQLLRWSSWRFNSATDTEADYGRKTPGIVWCNISTTTIEQSSAADELLLYDTITTIEEEEEEVGLQQRFNLRKWSCCFSSCKLTCVARIWHGTLYRPVGLYHISF